MRFILIFMFLDLTWRFYNALKGFFFNISQKKFKVNLIALINVKYQVIICLYELVVWPRWLRSIENTVMQQWIQINQLKTCRYIFSLHIWIIKKLTRTFWNLKLSLIILAKKKWSLINIYFMAGEVPRLLESQIKSWGPSTFTKVHSLNHSRSWKRNAYSNYLTLLKFGSL